MNLVTLDPPIIVSAKGDYPLVPIQYLEWIAKKSRNTLRSYAYALVQYLQWCEDNSVDWTKATSAQVIDFRSSLKGSKSTLKYLMGRLVDFYEFAARKGIANPTTPILPEIRRMRRGLRKEIKTLPPEQIGEFIRGFTNQRDQLMAELMFFTGLRRCEVLGLDRRFLTTAPHDKAKKMVRVLVMGKGRSARTVEISVAFRTRLAAYASGTKGTLLFSTPSGKQYHPDTVQKAFAANCVRTKIEIRPHMLRHMYASYRLASLEKVLASTPDAYNSALKAVQTELGHAHITTTSVYLHIIDAEVASKSLQDWYAKAETLITKGGKP